MVRDKDGCIDKRDINLSHASDADGYPQSHPRYLGRHAGRLPRAAEKLSQDGRLNHENTAAALDNRNVSVAKSGTLTRYSVSLECSWSPYSRSNCLMQSRLFVKVPLPRPWIMASRAMFSTTAARGANRLAKPCLEALTMP